MEGIKISRPAEAERRKLDLDSWDRWECGRSSFPWYYEAEETCYILEGRVTVETAQGKVEIGPGDLVTFPAGLDCTWHVHEPVKKAYRFG